MMNRIKLLIVSSILASNFSLANNTVTSQNVNTTESAPPVPYARGDENDGLGGAGPTPIDDYAPLLLITAIGIAGVIYYREKQQLIKK